MRITAKMFTLGCVFVALLVAAYWLGAAHLNRSILDERSTEDMDVVLVPVIIDSSIPTNSWIRYYDVYASRIPWRNVDSNYLPLHFIPRGHVPHLVIRPALSPHYRSDILDFVGVLGDTIKPFCPRQADIDSGKPFIIYLDYISSDLTGQGIDHAEIKLDKFD
jgi:hypothetical protein